MVTEADYPLLLTILTAVLAWLASELDRTRRGKMARKSSDFRREATKLPYQLELENGETVTFQDPNRLTTRSAFELAAERDPEKVLRTLLGKDFTTFWAEFGERPAEETNAVIEDATSYYGVNPGKLGNSPS